MYSAGPLAAGFAYAADSSDDVGFAKTTDMSLGASYDAGVVKGYFTYQTDKVDVPNAKTDKGMALTAVAPIGNDSIVLTLSKETVDTTAASDDKTGTTLAYMHNMSKMTTVYAGYAKTSNSGGANVDVSNIGVGIRQKF